MATIAPFRGITYDPARVDPARVLAPPYDVIDAAGRADLAAADPHNVVRLILPEADDATGVDRYQAAARTFDEWLASGVLRRDAYKSVYRYHQIFQSAELGDRTVTRRGLIAAVRLDPPSSRTIRPHERTLKAPREDRLHLMAATRAHFSQIFTMFQDPAGEVDRLFRKVEGKAPDVDARTADGVRHVMWRVADAELIGKLRHVLAPKPLYIADGHHRCETMAALRDRLAAEAGELGQYSAAQFGTMFLASMDDPGLVVLPTHRIVFGLPAFDPADLLARAREYFIVEPIPGGAGDAAALRAAIVHGPGGQPAFAAVLPGEADAWRFTLDPHVNPVSVGLSGHPAVVRLDVTLLHGLLLERILDISPAAQEAGTHLRYVKDTGAALAEIAAGRGQVGFIMNPPKIEQVRAVADAGEVMPQKSTYFYPKLASGLVMARIDPDEDLI